MPLRLGRVERWLWAWTTISALVPSTVSSSEEESCGLWLGPSPIKEQEEHGYGLGMFTGKKIAKGTIMHSELFFPLYDFEDEDHPPFREYMWSGEEHNDLVLESFDSMLIFSPGLAAIAPCTSYNYNLERLYNHTFDNAGVHRSKDATAGSFTYHHLAMFRAIRDIKPGEELTVECSDDDFDGAPHSLVRFDSADDKVFCLDDKLEEKKSSFPGVGRGVFAKKDLAKGSRVLSSPMVPIDRRVLDIMAYVESDHQANAVPIGKQLITNYCYGHPDSDLLWLPYGPLMNSINHASAEYSTSNKKSGRRPNVQVRWHEDPDLANDELGRRKQYHHPELLEMPADRVAKIHGKGLVMDVVAIQDIPAGEEIFLDYGAAWEKAWATHQSKWATEMGKYEDTQTYFPAMEYNKAMANEPVRTITEQHRKPYPSNLITACRFQQDWIEDEYAEEYDMIQYQSWDTQVDHMRCLLPCVILERLENEGEETTYTAKLVDHHHENTMISYSCHIFRRFEYIYENLPRRGIEFVEKTYASDIFLMNAFRQPIQVSSEDMYPDNWRKTQKRIRLRSNSASSSVSASRDVPSTDEVEEDEHEQELFKRKNIEPKYDKEDLQRKQSISPKMEL